MLVAALFGGFAVVSRMLNGPSPAPSPSPLRREIRTYELQTSDSQANLVARDTGDGVVVLEDGIEITAPPSGAVRLDVPNFRAEDFEAVLVAWFVSGTGTFQLHFHLRGESGDAVSVFSDGRVGGLGHGSARFLLASAEPDPLTASARLDLPVDELNPFTLRLKSLRYSFLASVNQRTFGAGTYPHAGGFGLKLASDPGSIEPLRLHLQSLQITAPPASRDI